jgi:uncharacterized cupredoxin-like copper-binding protein
MYARLAGLVAAVAVVASVAVLPATARTGHATATTVTVTAGKPSEFRFTLSTKTVKHGVVTFKVTNKGAITHNFTIAGKHTPNLAKGKSATLKVTFAKAGKFTYECGIPGHAAAGMKGVLTVK